MQIHRITELTVVTRVTTECHTWGAVCFFDRHPSVAAVAGPMITAFITVFVAGAGWWWSSGGEKRKRKSFGKTADRAVRAAVQASGKLVTYAAANSPLEFASVGSEELNRSATIPVLDNLLEMPVSAWPSAEMYISTRSLRDQLKRLLHYAEKLDPVEYRARSGPNAAELAYLAGRFHEVRFDYFKAAKAFRSASELVLLRREMLANRRA